MNEEVLLLRTHALSLSVDVPGWRETRRLDCASIWSSESLTEGRSGRDKWEVRALDADNSEERSAAMVNVSIRVCQAQGNEPDVFCDAHAAITSSKVMREL